jgi:hypothetical protein
LIFLLASNSFGQVLDEGVTETIFIAVNDVLFSTCCSNRNQDKVGKILVTPKILARLAKRIQAKIRLSVQNEKKKKNKELKNAVKVTIFTNEPIFS